MAKEFKDWDKRFSQEQIKLCRLRWLSAGFSHYDDAGFEKALDDMGYAQPSVAEARFAVYEADGFEDWQLFRVSMKGLTTRQKIAMCRHRWNSMITCNEGDSVIETHRIWNYLGALKRGGQLVDGGYKGLVIAK